MFHSCRRLFGAASSKNNNNSAFLPRHRNSKTATNLRRPQQPRAGNLEPAHIITATYADRTNDPFPVAYGTAEIGDVRDSPAGQLSYWRDVMDMASNSHGRLPHSSTQRPASAVPSWSFVVPLLESLREHGRVLNGASTSRSAAGRMRRSPRGVGIADPYNDISNTKYSYTSAGSGEVGRSASSAAADRLVGNEDAERLSVLPRGERLAPEAVQKMFAVELLVRMPLLEHSLKATCSPVLLGRLCAAMLYCDFPLPSLNDIYSVEAEKKQHQRQQPQTDSSLSSSSSSMPFGATESSAKSTANNLFRLRAVMVQACLKCDEILAAEEKKSNNNNTSELRKVRTLALEAPWSSAVHELIFARGLIVDEKFDGGNVHSALTLSEGQSSLSSLSAWAQRGAEFMATGQQQFGDNFGLLKAPTKPVSWSDSGKLEASS